jgi:predicted DNA-binding transcriptional regulator YafY
VERAITKAERLLQIESLLLAHPEGLSQAEIARRLGVNRSTIHRYLPDLTNRFAIYELDDGRLAIDRDHYLMNVRLTLHESMAVHLAARLMATRSDKQNPHAAAALRKLGLALQKLAPRVAEHLQASASVMEDQAQRHDPVYLLALEALTRAWSDGQVAHVWHRMEDGRVFDYDLAPYFIEPYAVGQTTHVIGWREPPGALRTFKLERIQRVELTDQHYTIPEDFDPRRLLAEAWGIWYTEAEPVEVVLRFHPRAAVRVRETRWHRSEQVEELPDGSLVWRARVAEPREMLPWVRGWGADVEVLGPAELRGALMGEARRLAEMYSVGLLLQEDSSGGNEAMDVFQEFLTLPGKTEPQLTIFEHSSDVFHVALYLLAQNQANVRNPHLVKAGALLHDVGKIEQDVLVGKQWNHQPHSAKYLPVLLAHPRMKALLADNGVDLTEVSYDDLLLICEHHHDIATQPSLLRRCPDALLVSVADVVASALESGWLGDIRQRLSASTYVVLNLSLLANLGLAGGLDGEIHRVDLPGGSVADAMLNDLIFRDMSRILPDRGLDPILQKGGSLWVVGDPDTLRAFLANYAVNPRTLYESADLADEIYEGVLAAMPAPGSLSADSIRYLLVNERIARKVAQGLVDRKRVRQALEHFDISVPRVHEMLGSRDRTVTDKLEAIAGSPKYLITGAQAAYRYHHWRVPPQGDFELLVDLVDWDTWYAYLRDSRTLVGKEWPTADERRRYTESVVLRPGLTEALWERRLAADELMYISPMDIVFHLLATQTEAAVGEALAILIARRMQWDWAVLAVEVEDRRMARQFGCLFEVINHESGQVVVPQEVVERLFARVQDTVGEAVFTFPLGRVGEGLPVAGLPPEYQAIGRRWGLDLLVPRHLVLKVLDDLGA